MQAADVARPVRLRQRHRRGDGGGGKGVQEAQVDLLLNRCRETRRTAIGTRQKARPRMIQVPGVLVDVLDVGELQSES